MWTICSLLEMSSCLSGTMLERFYLKYELDRCIYTCNIHSELNLGSKLMEPDRISIEEVRSWDGTRLAKEYEHYLSTLSYHYPGGVRQTACIENLRTIGQEAFRRLELAHATA